MKNMLIVFLSILFTCNCFSLTPIGEKINDDILDPLEETAKLLLDLDAKIEQQLEISKKLLKPYPQLYIPPNDGEIAIARESKFSELLRDLALFEEQIRSVMNSAASDGQRRVILAARLRPLLTYVGYIRRNLDMLRNRVVAVATLSTISSSVNDAVESFGDIMTGSNGPIILPEELKPLKPMFDNPPKPSPSSTTLSASVKSRGSSTTLKPRPRSTTTTTKKPYPSSTLPTKPSTTIITKKPYPSSTLPTKPSTTIITTTTTTTKAPISLTSTSTFNPPMTSSTTTTTTEASSTTPSTTTTTKAPLISSTTTTTTTEAPIVTSKLPITSSTTTTTELPLSSSVGTTFSASSVPSATVTDPESLA